MEQETGDNKFSNQTEVEYKLPEIFEFDFDKHDKKWQKKEADVTDYFNYGFNEETFRLYVNRLRLMHEQFVRKKQKLSENNLTLDEQQLKTAFTGDLHIFQPGLPVDFGGFDFPYFFRETFA